jgi:hypothetical protein
MLEVIPINSDDRLAARVLRRSAEDATQELISCTGALTECLTNLAQAYPGCIGVGCIVAGKVRGVMVLAGSADGDLCSTVALDRMRSLAKIIATMSPDLRGAFESEFNFQVSRRQIEAEMEKAAAALRARVNREGRDERCDVSK